MIACLVGLNGCRTVRPQPLSPEDVRTSNHAARDAAQAGVEALHAPLTLDEALARALKYNLQERTRRIEQAVALNLWEAGKFDLLPRVMTSAGYRWRDSDLITRSQDSVTGQPSLANPFISSEREQALADLGASWSVLDFTVGYYTAHQNADRVLIAAEHRRKAMHALCRDVAIAFWRMAGAQQLLQSVQAAIATAEGALADAAQAQAEGLRSPVDNLRYQRQMLENIRLLSTIEKDFASARATLASLINVPPGTSFTVVEPTEAPSIAMLEVPVDELEELALLQNADLRDHVYQIRIARTEARKTLAKLLPNLSLNYSLRHSTDDFLINNSWSEAGVLISQNLTGLLSLPTQRRLAAGGVALAEQRRVAVQMAVLVQVHLARLEVASAHRQLLLAERIWALDEEIKRHADNRAEAEADSRLSQVAAETSSIVGLLRRYQALADFNVAASALQSTLGLEIDLASVETQSLGELTTAVSRWRAAWQTGTLQPAPSSL